MPLPDISPVKITTVYDIFFIFNVFAVPCVNCIYFFVCVSIFCSKVSGAMILPLCIFKFNQNSFHIHAFNVMVINR